MNDIMDSYESMEEKELMASKVNTHGINAMNLIFCHVLVINAWRNYLQFKSKPE